MSLKEENLENIVKIALDALRHTNDILIKHWQRYYYHKKQNMVYTSKKDLSPVTQLDFESEQTIRNIVLENYPDHRIVGEEMGEEEYKLSPYLWIIDPIDGTKNYIRGLKYFATQIAVMHEGEVVVGISSAPALNETMVAFKNGGTFLNDKKIHASKVSQLRNAFITHGNIKYFSRSSKLLPLAQLAEKAWAMRGFGDCWNYHLVAYGGIDAMLEAKAKIWDIAAVSLIVKEAGGRVTDIDGYPISFESTSIIASNNFIHDEILSIIKNEQGECNGCC
jgi:histidinol-phosphatase